MEEINTGTIEDQIAAQDVAIEAAQQRGCILRRAIVELLIDRSDRETCAILDYQYKGDE